MPVTATRYDTLKAEVQELLEPASQEPTMLAGIMSMPQRRDLGTCPKLEEAFREGSISRAITNLLRRSKKVIKDGRDNWWQANRGAS